MSGYLLSIIGVVFITGILSAVMPEGKTSGAIKTAAKLCCLLVILTPVAEYFVKGGVTGENIFSDFSDLAVIQTDESFIDYCSRKRVEEAEESIRKEIEEEYSLSVTVQIEWEYAESDEIKILRITLGGVAEQTEDVTRSDIASELYSKYGVEVVFL